MPHFGLGIGGSRGGARIFVLLALVVGVLCLAAVMYAPAVNAYDLPSSRYDGELNIGADAAQSYAQLLAPAVPTAVADAAHVYDPLHNRVATNTADDLLPGLPSNAPKPAGLGSTGRTAPSNLTEQLAMTEVRAAPGGTQLPNVVMGDTRWPAADGWVKMRQVVNGVDIHYVRNTITGAVDDFKFIGGSG